MLLFFVYRIWFGWLLMLVSWSANLCFSLWCRRAICMRKVVIVVVFVIGSRVVVILLLLLL